MLRSITSNIPKFETLNLPPILKDIALRKRGLVIFVGGACGIGARENVTGQLSFPHAIRVYRYATLPMRRANRRSEPPEA